MTSSLLLVVSKQNEARPVCSCQMESSAHVVVFSNPTFGLRISHRRLMEGGRFQPGSEVLNGVILVPSAGRDSSLKRRFVPSVLP